MYICESFYVISLIYSFISRHVSQFIVWSFEYFIQQKSATGKNVMGAAIIDLHVGFS